MILEFTCDFISTIYYDGRKKGIDSNAAAARPAPLKTPQDAILSTINDYDDTL
jgi:hypothetical protein